MPEPVREIDPEFFELLGRIATRWSFAESMIGEFFAFLLNADPGYVYILTQSVSGSTVVGWVRTALPFRVPSPEARQAIMGLLTRIDDARAERNAWVHGLWGTHMTGSDTVTVQTVRYERTEIIKTEVVTRADMRDLLREIGEIIAELKALNSAATASKGPA
jgi:hypothetical protein